MFKKILPLFLLILSVSSLHAQTVAYVVNNGSNTVSVIDTATNTVTATIPVGHNPLGAVFSPDGTRAYVTNQTDGTISVIDTASNSVTATIPVETGSPSLVLPTITPDGKSLYVPDPSNGLFVVSTATNSVVATIPAAAGVAVAITPDGTRAYVPGGVHDLVVLVIDTTTNTIVTTITGVPQFGAGFIADTPNGLTIYVTGTFDEVVSAIATSSNTVTASITFPFNTVPEGIIITPDGSRAYVSTIVGAGGPDVVNIIDTSSNTLEPGTITVGNGLGFLAGFLAVTPDGAFVYVTNPVDNTVSVIATATNTVIATVPVGTTPLGIAIASLSPVIPISGTACNGTFNGTFKGNVTVKAGQSCTFANGGVTGNVQVNGGTLNLFRSTVGGNVQISGAGAFTIGPGTSVGGDLQVQNLPASTGQNQICGTSVHGNLTFQNSGTALLIGGSSSCTGNSVGNDLTVQNNTAATSIIGNTVTGNLVDQGNTAPTQVFNNIVGNNLQCQSNTSISGGGNTAKSKQGQCTSF